MTLRRGRHPYRPDAQALATETQLAWRPTHRQLEHLIDQVAAGNGWRIKADHDSRGEAWSANSGWPDRFYLRRGKVVAVELKVPPDDLTDEQRTWLEQLNEVPGITAVVLRSTGGYTADLTAMAGLLR